LVGGKAQRQRGSYVVNDGGGSLDTIPGSKNRFSDKIMPEKSNSPIQPVESAS
jgi:hypothetical protein